MPVLVTGILLVLQGNKEGLRKLKLKIEDPPRRKHTGNTSAAYAHESRLLAVSPNWTAVTHDTICNYTQGTLWRKGQYLPTCIPQQGRCC